MSDRPSDAYLRATLAEIEQNAELVTDDDREPLMVAAAVLAWVLGDADEPDLPQPDWCGNCGGRGGWPLSYDRDGDEECGRCGGTGVEP